MKCTYPREDRLLADTTDESPRQHGPVVWRRWLGAELVRLRGVAKLKQSDAARALSCSVAKISYLESGDRPPTPDELRDVLLPLYGVSEQEQQAYLDAADKAVQGAWWDEWNDEDFPEGLIHHIGLEAGARLIRIFQLSLIPGLLQTEAYATAVLESNPTLSRIQVDQAVQLRLRRQSLLRKGDSPDLKFIVDQSTLLRVVGSQDTLRQQLAHLVRLIEDIPNLELRVVPFDAGAHGAFTESFTILDFDLGHPVATREGFGGDLSFIESRRIVPRYSEAFKKLWGVALGVTDSLELIRSSLRGGLV